MKAHILFLLCLFFTVNLTISSKELVYTFDANDEPGNMIGYEYAPGAHTPQNFIIDENNEIFVMYNRFLRQYDKNFKLLYESKEILSDGFLSYNNGTFLLDGLYFIDKTGKIIARNNFHNNEYIFRNALFIENKIFCYKYKDGKLFYNDKPGIEKKTYPIIEAKPGIIAINDDGTTLLEIDANNTIIYKNKPVFSNLWNFLMYRNTHTDDDMMEKHKDRVAKIENNQDACIDTFLIKVTNNNYTFWYGAPSVFIYDENGWYVKHIMIEGDNSYPFVDNDGNLYVSALDFSQMPYKVSIWKYDKTW